MICLFCNYEDVDEACGCYGCPNCNGEGLDPKETPMKPFSDDLATARCDSCCQVFNAGVLLHVKDPTERLTAGEEVPAGECPECGGLAYLEPPPKPLHSDLTVCKQCKDPIYEATLFEACAEVCAACQDEPVDELATIRQEAYSDGFSNGRRQRRRDEQAKATEFADLFAHRIRNWTGPDDDVEILDLIEADAKRLGVI